jgi:hypothetical protein
MSALISSIEHALPLAASDVVKTANLVETRVRRDADRASALDQTHQAGARIAKRSRRFLTDDLIFGQVIF